MLNRPSEGPPLPEHLGVKWPWARKIIRRGEREKFGDEGYIESWWEKDIWGDRYFIQEYHLKREIPTERIQEICKSFKQYGYDVTKPKLNSEWVFTRKSRAGL